MKAPECLLRGRERRVRHAEPVQRLGDLMRRARPRHEQREDKGARRGLRHPLSLTVSVGPPGGYSPGRDARAVGDRAARLQVMSEAEIARARRRNARACSRLWPRGARADARSACHPLRVAAAAGHDRKVVEMVVYPRDAQS